MPCLELLQRLASTATLLSECVQGIEHHASNAAGRNDNETRNGKQHPQDEPKTLLPILLPEPEEGPVLIMTNHFSRSSDRRPDTIATVWNRRGTLPGSFPNDQPENEDAGNGLGNIGDNWLFARVRRKAAAPAGALDVTVQAHFLVSKLGTGSNFEDATDSDPDITISGPDPTPLFTAAEVGPKTTDALQWHLNPIASTHLCAAVEISTPADPFLNVTLHGRAPGWPTQDLEIVDDNNKAQRNMGLSTTPARGVGLSLAATFGLVHNAATFPRDLLIRYSIPEEFLRRIPGLQIEIPGRDPIEAKATGTFVLAGMQPGENRWVGARFRPPKGQEGEALALFFDEIVNGAAVNNGFPARAERPGCFWPLKTRPRSRMTLQRAADPVAWNRKTVPVHKVTIPIGMSEYLKSMEPILMLLFGWCMGLLAPAITEKIRRTYRRRDLIAAVTDEFAGLQYTMALVAHRIRGRNSELTDEFLDRIIPVVESYHGPERDERLIETVKGSRQGTEAERATVHKALRKPNSSLMVRQYASPLFVTQLADLAICPISFQRVVLNVRYHLDLYNQSVPYLQSLSDKTFGALDAENHALVLGNLEQGYRELGERAEITLEAINRVKAHRIS